LNFNHPIRDQLKKLKKPNPMEIVLLLGAPGAGKSTFGRIIGKMLQCEFFSAGNFLRDQGLLFQTDVDLKAEAAAALRSKLQKNGLLVLEYVKDIDDAHMLMKILRESGSTLTQAILLTETERAMHPMLLEQLGIERGNEHWVWGHAEARKVADRLPKWRTNVGRIIEYFSSLGVLTVFENADPMLHRNVAQPSQRIKSMYGYKLEPLRSVVAQCLVANNDEARSILQSAAHSAGLLELLIPVPRVAIRTQADVDWVSQPGRYTVSKKCDGTRYLLIKTSTGAVYFKNRVDFVYSFPLETENSIPPNTILDGELVWHYSNGGHFFVFDALMVDGRRVWHLPLHQRLAELKWLSTQIPPVRYIDGLHRQRMPHALATVRAILKPHYTIAAFRKLSPTRFFPNDGLIFTPVAMPYVLPVLMRKWQPCDQRACDIQGPNGLVFECVYHQDKWTPVAIRWDKIKGQGDEEIGQQCKDPSTFLHGMNHPLAYPNLPPTPYSMPPPPKRAVLSKQECLQAVSAGLAQRTLDASSGLEIFNNLKGTYIPCRGAVYDGDVLVAAAFEPFESVSYNSVDNNQWTSASFKLDGTLIVAFLHKGKVCTSTRRRMDSEQAAWARERIAPSMLKEGWTYAFEAIYRENTHVVRYPFEGLVFLHSWSPDGRGSCDFDASNIMCAPSVVCRMRELEQLLLTSERGPPTFEGWVVRNREGKRLKWVQEAYKTASRMIPLQLHPVAVWHEIRMGGTGAVDRRMPEHAVEEKRAIIRGLERRFDEQLRAWYEALEFSFDAHRTWEDMNWMDGCCVLSYLEVDDKTLQSGLFKRRNCFCILSRETLQSACCLKTNWADFWDFDVRKFGMFYKRAGPSSILRVEIMDRIKPAFNGTMPYYTPSANFAQTFAKGWKDGVRTANKPPLIAQVVLDPLMEHIFHFLDLDSIANAVLVCKAWKALIVGDRRLMDKVHLAMCYGDEVVEGGYLSVGAYGSGL